MFETLQIIRMVSWNSKRLMKFLVQEGLSRSEARNIVSEVRKQACYELGDWENVADLFATFADDIWQQTGLTTELFEQLCDFML